MDGEGDVMETPISPKVAASAGGGGAGLALSVIIVWLLTANGVEVPSEVGTAIGSLLTLGLGSGAAWAKRDRLRDIGQAVERQGKPEVG